MKTKKNIKESKLELSNKTNTAIMNTLKKYIDKMHVQFDDKHFTKLIFDKIKSSIVDTNKVNSDYHLVDFKKNDVLKPSTFFDASIIDHIYKTIHYEYNIKFKYKQIDFFVNIYSKKKINIDIYTKYIKIVICLCLQEAKDVPSETFVFDLFLTDIKKSIPYDFQNNVISKHINSGFSQYIDKMYICIYRSEEWVKVFIHECFHAFNMDFHEEKINFINIFSNKFNIHSKFLIYESFVEFWARILNCGLFSYLIKENISFTDFHTIFTLNLNIERVHSLKQGTKLLNMFQLSYEDLITTDKTRQEIVKKTYNESTNAFCYYIITAILMNDFDKTIKWFDLNQNNLFNFEKTERQVVIFCFYIKQICDKDEIKNIFNEFNVHKIEKENYMNMSMFDIASK